MKRSSLKYSKTRKKIRISAITALLIAAQLSPIALGGMSDTEMMSCLSGLLKAVMIAEASVTDEKNSAELDKIYNVEKANGITYDYKYCKKTSILDRKVTYHKTLEGLENNKELREALKEMLGIPSFLPREVTKFMVLAPYDGSATYMSYMVALNYANVKGLLTSKSGRKKLAQLGEKYTDWIDADWAEAADLTVMAAFGVVNDDYNLIKYNKSKRTEKISREEFYTLLWRAENANGSSAAYNDINNYDKEEVEQKLGKDYKYNEFIYLIHEQLGGGVTDFNTGGFLRYQSKKFYQSDIPYLEAMSLIGRCLCYSTRSSCIEDDSADGLGTIKKELMKNFKNLKASNFVAVDKDSDISKHKLGVIDTLNLWAAWKAGILKPTKNGNLKWTGTITYKQAVQLTMKAIINESEGAADKSDYTDFVVLSASGNKNNGSNKSEEKKEVTLINYN